MAHLLRRGVISLRIGKQGLAASADDDRRVGRLLLEMGVIDEADSPRPFASSLEIVYDTVRWHEGEWEFAPGELPTLEEIILDRSLEDHGAPGRAARDVLVRGSCRESEVRTPRSR